MRKVVLCDQSFELFISEDEIITCTKELAHRINKDYRDKPRTFIVVLNGSFMFAAELLKHIEGLSKIEFIRLSSYNGLKSEGRVKQILGLERNLEKENVIIVEDIIDSGITLRYIIEELKIRNPESMEVATLLFKSESYQEDIKVSYIGKEIGNEFVVGYGMDYNGLGRNLKEIFKITNY